MNDINSNAHHLKFMDKNCIDLFSSLDNNDATFTADIVDDDDDDVD